MLPVMARATQRRSRTSLLAAEVHDPRDWRDGPETTHPQPGWSSTPTEVDDVDPPGGGEAQNHDDEVADRGRDASNGSNAEGGAEQQVGTTPPPPPIGNATSQCLCQFCDRTAQHACFTCNIDLCQLHSVRGVRFGVYVRTSMCFRCYARRDIHDSSSERSSDERVERSSKRSEDAPPASAEAVEVEEGDSTNYSTDPGATTPSSQQREHDEAEAQQESAVPSTGSAGEPPEEDAPEHPAEFLGAAEARRARAAERSRGRTKCPRCYSAGQKAGPHARGEKPFHCG
ncbi:hypothetical protein N9L68_02000 [bacterium]|nr:hypothetical protein [bacterium]